MATNTANADETPSSMTTAPPLTLLGLPLEVRTKIFEYLFDEARLEIVMVGHGEIENGLYVENNHTRAGYVRASRSATLVSKQIREEARPIYLAQTLILICSAIALYLIQESTPHIEEVLNLAHEAKLRQGMGIRNTLEWPKFDSFKSLETLFLDVYKSIQILPRARDNPPELERFAGKTTAEIVDLAESLVYGGPGVLGKFNELCRVPEEVEVRTRVMFFSAAKIDAEFMGVRLPFSQTSQFMLTLIAMDLRPCRQNLQQECRSL